MNDSPVVPTDRNPIPVTRVTRARALRRSGRIDDVAPAALTAYVMVSHGSHRTGPPPTRCRNRNAPSTFGRGEGVTVSDGVSVVETEGDPEGVAPATSSGSDGPRRTDTTANPLRRIATRLATRNEAT